MPEMLSGQDFCGAGSFTHLCCGTCSDPQLNPDFSQAEATTVDSRAFARVVDLFSPQYGAANLPGTNGPPCVNLQAPRRSRVQGWKKSGLTAESTFTPLC